MRVQGSTEIAADWSFRFGASNQAAAEGIRHSEQGTATADPRPSPALDPAVLDRIADRMSAVAQSLQTALQFKVVYGNRVVIKVINSQSGEVLSEFPPERLVEAFRDMRELLGLLVDEKV